MGSELVGGGGEVLTDGGLGYSSEFAVFSRPISNVGTLDVSYTKYRPTNNYANSDSPIDFRLPSAGMLYTDFMRSKLHVKCKIVQGNGEDLPSPTPKFTGDSTVPLWSPQASCENGMMPSLHDDPDPPQPPPSIPEPAFIAPVNLILSSMFSMCEVTMNGKLISNANPGIQFINYFNTLLRYGSDAKQSQLQASGWYKDESPYMDSVDWITGPNSGLKARGALFARSAEVCLEGSLWAPCLQLNKFLLNGIETKIRFTQASNPFRLISGNSDNPDYRLVITDIYLLICHVTPAASVLLAHQQTLANDDTLAHYSFMNQEIRTYNIAKGSWIFEQDDAFLGTIPNRVVLALVDSESLNGSYVKNPFSLQHRDANWIQVTVNGQDCAMSPLVPNFQANQYTTEYLSLFRAFHTEGADRGIALNLKEFLSGFTLFAFDLQPQSGQSNDGFMPFRVRGNVRLQIRFAKEVPVMTTLIAMIDYPSHSSVDKSRNIIKSS